MTDPALEKHFKGHTKEVNFNFLTVNVIFLQKTQFFLRSQELYSIQQRMKLLLVLPITPRLNGISNNPFVVLNLRHILIQLTILRGLPMVLLLPQLRKILQFVFGCQQFVGVRMFFVLIPQMCVPWTLVHPDVSLSRHLMTNRSNCGVSHNVISSLPSRVTQTGCDVHVLHQMTLSLHLVPKIKP